MTIFRNKSRLAVVALMLALAIMLSVPTFATSYTNGVPPTNVTLTVRCMDAINQVLNVYTSGAPASGNNVTLYTYSGSISQSWMNTENTASTSTKYVIRCATDTSLSLNYNQATTKCTVYTVANNNPNDFYLTFANGSYGIVVKLFSSGRYLGNSATTNGAQCYWYQMSSGWTNANIHKEDNWRFDS